MCQYFKNLQKFQLLLVNVATLPDKLPLSNASTFPDELILTFTKVLTPPNISTHPNDAPIQYFEIVQHLQMFQRFQICISIFTQV